MTHIFFSLVREPYEKPTPDMPVSFSFDTHIITQININVKHTLFDKVWFSANCQVDLTIFLDFCNWWNSRPVLWTFNYDSSGNMSSYHTFPD